MACNTGDCTDTATACANSAGEPIGTASAGALTCNASALDKVVNGGNLTATTRTGKTISTLKGLEAGYIMSAINGGVWAVGITFTAYNQYMVYNGIAYKPIYSTTLPYVSEVTPNVAFVEPFCDLTSGNLSTYTNIVYATVTDLSLGIPVFAPIGSLVYITERGATCTVSNTGVADGIELLDAGSGNIATVQPLNGSYVVSHLGGTHDTSDSSAAINRAMEKSNYTIDGDYSISASLLIQNDTDGIMEAAQITALNDTFDAMTGTANHSFTMSGRLAIIGSGKAGVSKGVNLFDCYDYDINCLINVSEFETGIFCDGTTIAAGLLAGHRGRQGRWTNPTAHNNQNGIQVLRRSEYTLWSNPQSTQNTVVGWINTAGNTNVVGGNIQDNQNGVLLQETGTSNANHGMFTGTNLNHNIGYNLRTEDCQFGHTFNGCHIYGDSASAGTIELIRSSGINISDGIIDAKITIEGVTTPTAIIGGYNRIAGNQMDETYTVFNSSDDGREQTIVTGNFQRNGDAWGLNDRAFVSVQADAVGGTQTLLDATLTTIVFNNEKDDNRLQYDDTTGVFTAAFAQNLTVDSTISLSISGGTFIDGYITFIVNGASVAFVALAATSTASTFVTGIISRYSAYTPTTTIEIGVFCNVTGGTITVGADAGTAIGIRS